MSPKERQIDEFELLDVKLKIGTRDVVVHTHVDGKIDEKKVRSFLMEQYLLLTGELFRLKKPISEYRTHGAKRSSREVRDIQKQRKGKIPQIENILTVFQGESEGVLEVLTSGNEPVGLSILSNNNKNEASL